MPKMMGSDSKRQLGLLTLVTVVFSIGLMGLLNGLPSRRVITEIDKSFGPLSKYVFEIQYGWPFTALTMGPHIDGPLRSDHLVAEEINHRLVLKEKGYGFTGEYSMPSDVVYVDYSFVFLDACVLILVCGLSGFACEYVLRKKKRGWKVTQRPPPSV